MGASDGSVVGITKIFDSGPPSARWNLVIVAEGYRSSELAQFEADAEAARDALLAEPPFDRPEIACGINVYRLDVASTDSGADKPTGCDDGLGPSTADLRDTYFDATFCANGKTWRLLAGDSGLAQSTVEDYLPEWHQILVIVNDPERGGAGGSVGWTCNSSSDWLDVFIHELGHSAFGLGDEYDYDAGDTYTGDEPGQPNVSKESDPAAVKWSALVDAGSDDPTMPNADCTTANNDPSPVAAGLVGTFEGAGHWRCGLYRPVYSCMMRTTSAGFCPVCTQTIVDVMTEFAQPAPGGDVTAAVTTVDFNEVPEGLSVVRAARFMVDSCFPVTFELTTPPASPYTAESPTTMVASPSGPAPWPAWFWFRFECDSLGPVPGGTATIRCLETGEDFEITLTGTCVPRPTVAAELVFDRSGSMLDHTDEGRTKEEVLEAAASVFVDLLYDDNGIGMSAYDHDPHPIMDIEDAGAPGSMQGRDTAISEIASFAANPFGFTAIGDGVEQAKAKLDAADYDRKAMIVLTDGKETAGKYLSEVSDGVIGQTAFAIGLGTPELIEPTALATLTAGTGGYLLMTGHLGTDETFLLEKYYLQILAGVNNNDIILDPEGRVRPGVVERIPFDVSAADVEITGVVIARPAHLLRMALEAPDGAIIDEFNASVTSHGTHRSRHIRAGLPLLGPGGAVHQGRWHLRLALDEKYHNRLSHGTAYDASYVASYGGAQGVRYAASVHAHSNLRLHAAVLQSGFTPGSDVTVQARLTEYGAPFQGHATAWAEVTRPDSSTGIVPLPAVLHDAGLFEATFTAAMSGVYRFRILSRGRTRDELPFTREQLRTAVTWHGGDRPAPTGGGSNQRDWCDLVECLLDGGVLSDEALKRLTGMGIDIQALRRCLRRACETGGGTDSKDVDELAKELQRFVKKVRALRS